MRFLFFFYAIFYFARFFFYSLGHVAICAEVKYVFFSLELSLSSRERTIQFNSWEIIDDDKNV